MSETTVHETHEDIAICKKYSPILHLARIRRLSFSKKWEEGPFAMLTVAFDASGHAKQPVLVVAGFIASAEEWLLFDIDWRKRLAADGLNSFHMQEYAQASGPFKVFKNEERRRQLLLADLTDIIFQYARRKFGAAVVNSDLASQISEQERKAFALSAYGIAGRGAVGNVDEWAKENPVERDIRYVFEDGDFNKGDLMRRMAEDGFAAPSFEPKTDRPGRNGSTMQGFTALQAADTLAYEYALAVQRKRDGKFPKSRWGHLTFDKMPGDIGKFTVKDIGRIGEHFTQ
jgi:hypothetical protein